MNTVLSWLENDFDSKKKGPCTQWAKTETETIKGSLFCNSILVHDGIKVGQCPPGTIEAELTLEIIENGKEPVKNTQSIFLGHLPEEILNRPFPSRETIENYLSEVNLKFSKVLSKYLKQIGKKYEAFEILPQDLLFKPNPMEMLIRQFDK